MKTRARVFCDSLSRERGESAGLSWRQGDGRECWTRTELENRGEATINLLVMEKLGNKTYSWIGRPVQAHTKLICSEVERATADLNIRMKSSRRGASNGAGHNFIFSFFGELFLKIDEKGPKFFCAPHSWMHLVESSNTDVSGASEVPQSHGFLRKSSCCVFARELISLVKIYVDRDRSKHWNTSDN